LSAAREAVAQPSDTPAGPLYGGATAEARGVRRPVLPPVLGVTTGEPPHQSQFGVCSSGILTWCGVAVRMRQKFAMATNARGAVSASLNREDNLGFQQRSLLSRLPQFNLSGHTVLTPLFMFTMGGSPPHYIYIQHPTPQYTRCAVQGGARV
jgi:hypothetical protein